MATSSNNKKSTRQMAKPYNRPEALAQEKQSSQNAPKEKNVSMDTRPEWLRHATYSTLYQTPLLPKSDKIYGFKTDMQLRLTQRTEDKAMFLHLRKFTPEGIATKEGITIPLELLKIFGKTYNEYDSEENDDETLPAVGQCDSKVFGHLMIVCNSENVWFMIRDYKTGDWPRYGPSLRLNYEEYYGFLECCKTLWNLGL